MIAGHITTSMVGIEMDLKQDLTDSSLVLVADGVEIIQFNSQAMNRFNLSVQAPRKSLPMSFFLMMLASNGQFNKNFQKLVHLMSRDSVPNSTLNWMLIHMQWLAKEIFHRDTSKLQSAMARPLLQPSKEKFNKTILAQPLSQATTNWDLDSSQANKDSDMSSKLWITTHPTVRISQKYSFSVKNDHFKWKIQTTDKTCHKRSSSAPSLSKEKRVLNISSGGTLKRKMPQARKAHFDSTTNNKTPPMEEKRTHGLSFKRANFSLDRIPLPQVNIIAPKVML